jgi:hypothetical protein
MTETEHERKVVEYWAKISTRRFSIYDIGSIDLKNSDDSTLPYEPTAVLTSTAPPTNQPRKRFSIYDLSK